MPLPPFLTGGTGGGEVTRQHVIEALRITGHFLDARVLAPAESQMPAIRERLVSLLGR